MHHVLIIYYTKASPKSQVCCTAGHVLCLSLLLLLRQL